MVNEKTYIIIVTYNAMPWIQKCLDSCKDYLVCVIDNASSDETIPYIKENYPETHILPQDKNLGFGQANNVGMRYALDQGANYVFLLNQDAYLQKDSIEKLIKVHHTNSDFGILSPIHLNGDGTRLDANFSKYVAYQNNPDFYSHFILKKKLQPVYEVPFVNAAGWFLPIETINTVGGFDPIFFHYGEDDNYCQRVQYHGYKIGVVPTTYLKHDREVRPKKQIAYGSEAYYNKLERNYKVQYGNINVDVIGIFEVLKQKRKRQYFKALLKGRFSNAAILKKETQLFSALIPQLEKSRTINQEKGAHYF